MNKTHLQVKLSLEHFLIKYTSGFPYKYTSAKILHTVHTEIVIN